MAERAEPVELSYRTLSRHRSSRRAVIVRSSRTGVVLLMGKARTSVEALRVAAALLAQCEARGWSITRIEPFPWAEEVLRAAANDDARDARDEGRRA